MNVEDFAESQYGLITRADALRFGLSDQSVQRRVARGRWSRVYPGVYRVVGAPVTRRQRVLAACLAAGPDALASFGTAGRMLRLDAIPAPPSIDVAVPRSTGLSMSGVRIHRTSVMPRVDSVVVDGIPCTSATRTLIDCAAFLDDEALEAAFESARRFGLTSPRWLSRRADELCGSGRPGSRRVRALIAHQVAGQRHLESRLEVKLARLLRASALPPPVRQFPVGPYRVDFVWPERLLGVEADGFQWHGYRLAWKRDRRRVAAIEARGWRLVHVTWDDVDVRPAETLERLAHALFKAA